MSFTFNAIYIERFQVQLVQMKGLTYLRLIMTVDGEAQKATLTAKHDATVVIDHAPEDHPDPDTTRILDIEFRDPQMTDEEFQADKIADQALEAADMLAEMNADREDI